MPDDQAKPVGRIVVFYFWAKCAHAEKREGVMKSSGGTPTIVPCWQAFEPKVQSGRLVASLGFSERAEHAHRNQGRFPL